VKIALFSTGFFVRYFSEIRLFGNQNGKSTKNRADHLFFSRDYGKMEEENYGGRLFPPPTA
jgi:hypothetical protein